MTEKPANMIAFRRITPEDRALFESRLPDGVRRGCDFTFANLYLWGRQSLALVHEHIVLFSQFSRRSVYPYPIGNGDKKSVLDAIIADAEARGIPCRITGLDPAAKQTLESLYPGRFRFHCDEGAFDYVYAINDLADLKGKKYQSKRNHINRFRDTWPDHAVQPLSEENLPAVRHMVQQWYEERLQTDPNGDYHMEQAALEKAFRDFRALNMEGLVLLVNGAVVAMTLASPISEDTFDVHFEKALAGINGAYAVINCEFARYIREKYPQIQYLDREEDLGLEGLRKAKQSYHPHHLIEKCWACLLEDGYEY